VAAALDDMPARVALAVARRDDLAAQDRHGDLAAVRVAGDGERDAVGDVREQVGVVAQEQDGRAGGDGAHCPGDVGVARARIGDPGHVEAAEVRDLVLEHPDAGRAQRGGDALAAVAPVVVAEHGEDAERGVQLAEPPRDGLGRHGRAAADVGVDEVAEQQDEVGGARVDRGDQALDALLVDVRRAGVQVGDQRDAQSVELRRPARQAQLALADAPVARLVPQRAPGDGGRGEGDGRGAGRGGSSAAVHARER